MLMLKLLADVLSAPIKGPINGFEFILHAINDQVESEALDESKVQGELMQLSLRYQSGEIDEAGYTAKEDALLQQLNEIRKYKESQAQEEAVTDESAADAVDTVVKDSGTPEGGV